MWNIYFRSSSSPSPSERILLITRLNIILDVDTSIYSQYWFLTRRQMSKKSELNLYAQNRHIPTPVYTSVTEKQGFSSTVTVGGNEYRSKKVHGKKKAAEDDAAAVAFEALTERSQRPLDNTTSKLERLSLETESAEPQHSAPPAPEAPFGAVKIATRTPSPNDVSKSLMPSFSNVSVDTSKSLMSSSTQSTPYQAVTDYTVESKVEILSNYCKARNLPEPTFTISEHSKAFTASITIGDHLLEQTPQSYGSFQEAKLSVTERAIASLDRMSVVLTSSLQGIPAPIPSCGSTHLPLQPPSFFTGTPQSTASFRQPTPSLSKGWSPQPTASLPPMWSPSLPLMGPPSLPPTGPPSLPLMGPPSLPPTGPPSLPPTESPSLPSGTPFPATPSASQGTDTNPKARLNQYCQKNHVPLPQYKLEYPNDKVGYLASVTLGDKTYHSTVPHETKKAAESEAATLALMELEGKSGGEGRVERPQEVGGATSATAGEGPASQGRAVPSGAAPSSYKNILQEYAQKSKLATPHYETMLSDNGFISTVSVTDRSGRPCTFSSDGQQAKKTAEQQAAQKACCELKLV